MKVTRVYILFFIIIVLAVALAPLGRSAAPADEQARAAESVPPPADAQPCRCDGTPAGGTEPKVQIEAYGNALQSVKIGNWVRTYVEVGVGNAVVLTFKGGDIGEPVATGWCCTTEKLFPGKAYFGLGEVVAARQFLENATEKLKEAKENLGKINPQTGTSTNGGDRSEPTNATPHRISPAAPSESTAEKTKQLKSGRPLPGVPLPTAAATVAAGASDTSLKACKMAVENAVCYVDCARKALCVPGTRNSGLVIAGRAVGTATVAVAVRDPETRRTVFCQIDVRVQPLPPCSACR